MFYHSFSKCVNACKRKSSQITIFFTCWTHLSSCFIWFLCFVKQSEAKSEAIGATEHCAARGGNALSKAWSASTSGAFEKMKRNKPNGDGLHPSSNGLHPSGDGLHPSSDGLHPSSEASTLEAMASTLVVLMASNLIAMASSLQ